LSPNSIPETKNPPVPLNRGIIILKIINSTPLLRGGSYTCRAGVLTLTAGGTVTESHRFAIQLSPWLPLDTQKALFNFIREYQENRRGVKDDVIKEEIYIEY
jgi:hypothetical protein